MNIANLADQQLNSTLLNISGKIDNYSGTLSLTIPEVADLKADCISFGYVIDIQNRIKKHSMDWTAYKNDLRSGKAGTPGEVPQWILPPAPVISKTDINMRLSKLIQRIKNHPNYTEAIGQDLGIVSIGSGMSVAEKAVLKPVIKIHLVAGQPFIEWKKGDTDGIEIQKAEGNSGEYHFLELDLHPHYLDKSPLPAAGQSVVWKYKAIYHINDERVGHWSDEVSVSVMG
jgi:hypothetical protein